MLMAASIIVKVIGALFKVPLANLYGAEGTGIFTYAYNVYSAMYVISTAGLPVAVSKMVAEANSLGRYREVNKIAKSTFVMFTCIGVASSLVIILGVDAFARWTSESARYAILATAPSIFFTCIVSAVRGYYQGLSNMVPTAISQVIEALGKLIIGLALARWLMSAGYSLEIVVAGAVTGVTLGTALSAVYVIFVKLKDRRHSRRLAESDTPCRSTKEIMRTLLMLAVPITISASVISLTNLIDGFVVAGRLQEGCMMTDAQATYLYGAYSLATTLFTVPQTFIAGIGVSIIPAISGARALGNGMKAQSLTVSAFRLTGLLAFPCAVGLGVMARPILGLLYYRQPEDVLVAAPLLQILAPAVFFVAMVSVTNSVLQAMGRAKEPMVHMLIGGIVKLTANFIMVGTPGINIHGAPVGTFLCYATITVLNLLAMRRADIHPQFARAFAKPLISAVVMGTFAWLVYPPAAGFVGERIGVLVTVGLAAIIYFLMLIATKALPKEDVLMLPKGEKIAKLLRMK